MIKYLNRLKILIVLSISLVLISSCSKESKTSTIPSPTPTKVSELQGSQSTMEVLLASIVTDHYAELHVPILSGNQSVLLVVIEIKVFSSSILRLDSDHFRIKADGKEIKEAGDIVDEIARVLHFSTMGDMLGSRLSNGDHESFLLAYKVPSNSSKYELYIDTDDLQKSINLAPWLSEPNAVASLLPPTPTATSFLTQTPDLGPTETATPTLSASATKQATSTPHPTPTPSLARRSGRVSTEWTVEVKGAGYFYEVLPIPYSGTETDGFWIVVVIDATNTSAGPSSLASEFDGFGIIDNDKGWRGNIDVSNAFAITSGALTLETIVPAGESGMYSLVFEIPMGHRPSRLTLVHGNASSTLIVDLGIFIDD